MKQEFDWTDDAINLLTRMYRAGDSAKQIAHAIGHHSRSAVCGKIRRLGLSQPTFKSDSPRKANRAAVRIQAKATQTVAPPRTAPAPVDATPMHIPFLDLTGLMCRWPFGERPNFTFCGCHKIADSSYCQAHDNLSKPPAPMRAKWAA